MARYIDAEALIEEMRECKYGNPCNDYQRLVNFSIDIQIVGIKHMPTADVIPISEVERLQEEATRYKRYFFRHDYDEMISEVLDEIDRFINSNCIEIKDERGIKGYVTSGVHFAIAELKKKYTGGRMICTTTK